MTIRMRLLVTYLGLIALGMSLVTGYVLWSFRNYFLSSEGKDLVLQAQALGESVGDALIVNDLERVRLLVERYGAPEKITLRVFDPQARLLATSVPDLDRKVPDWRAIPGNRAALAGRQQSGIARGVLSSEERLYVAQPIVRAGRQLGVLRISLALREFERQSRQVLQAVLATSAVAFVLCTLLSAQLARNLAAPIQAMRDFAVRLGSGSFGGKLDIRRPDELGDLARELNRMSERLAALDEERRSFLANVSHELRTPVSNVKVTLEALQGGAIEAPNLRERFLSTAYQEVERLRRLVEDLLDLGRLEAGAVPLQLQTVALKGLVARALLAVEPRMRQRQISVVTEASDAMVTVDPERILQAVLNVLENALKYSSTGSVVSLRAVIENGAAVISIADQGPGISERDLPYIFEQFYTGDRSRRGTGTGLGLAITRRIVEAHGGTITVASPPNQGANFTIRLPRKFVQPAA